MPKPRGYARVEYLAVKPDVEELLQRGHTVAFVYRQLIESGKVSMGYVQFYRYTSGVSARERSHARKTPAQTSPSLPKAPTPGLRPQLPSRKEAEPVKQELGTFRPSDFDYSNQAGKEQ